MVSFESFEMENPFESFEMENQETGQRFRFRWLKEDEIHAEGVRRQHLDGFNTDDPMPYHRMNANVITMEMLQLIETFPPDQRWTLQQRLPGILHRGSGDIALLLLTQGFPWTLCTLESCNRCSQQCGGWMFRWVAKADAQ